MNKVRRMLSAVGHPARRLVRTAIGQVALGSLKPGQFRVLSPDEVRALLDAAAQGEREEGPPAPPRPPIGRTERPAPAGRPAARETTRGSGEGKKGGSAWRKRRGAGSPPAQKP